MCDHEDNKGHHHYNCVIVDRVLYLWFCRIPDLGFGNDDRGRVLAIPFHLNSFNHIPCLCRLCLGTISDRRYLETNREHQPYELHISMNRTSPSGGQS